MTNTRRVIVLAAAAGVVAGGIVVGVPLVWALGKAAQEGAQWERNAQRSMFQSQHERRA